MAKVTITAALATHNEETSIKECIESLKLFADEIIVVDGKSQDSTAQIAKKMGAKVIETENKEMFHINKNMAIDNASSEWVFLIDADERVEQELASEIKKTISSTPRENGFWVNRRNWFLGGYLKKGGAYPDSVVRLFKKGKGRLPELSVHEQVKINGEVGVLKGDLLHMADPNFDRYLQRANRYTKETSRLMQEDNIPTTLLHCIYYLLIKPKITFLKIYIRHRGYVDGFRGFAWAFFSGAHYFYAYVKYLERKKILGN